MALSKERKVYLSVLTLGLGALAADRFFVLDEGPASASAADLLVKSDATSTPAAASPAPSFPEKLREQAASLSAEAAAGDVFMIPAAWLPKPAASSEPEPEQARSEDVSLAFADQLSLSSIAGSASGGVQSAVINKLLLSRGDRFDVRDGKARRSEHGAFELVEVTAESVKVRLVDTGATATLGIKTEQSADSRIQTRTRPSR